jgi:hypothetical protein
LGHGGRYRRSADAVRGVSARSKAGGVLCPVRHPAGCATFLGYRSNRGGGQLLGVSRATPHTVPRSSPLEGPQAASGGKKNFCRYRPTNSIREAVLQQGHLPFQVAPFPISAVRCRGLGRLGRVCHRVRVQKRPNPKPSVHIPFLAGTC